MSEQKENQSRLHKLAGCIAVLGLVIVVLGGCGDKTPSSVQNEKAGEQLNMIVDGTQVDSELEPIKDGRRWYLPLDPVVKAMGWTYKHEADNSLALSYSWSDPESTWSRQSTGTWLHDEWEDALRMVDGHIYIHSKRFSEVTDAEVKIDAAAGTIQVKSNPNPGVVTEAELEEQLAMQSKQEATAEETMSAEESEQINYGKYTAPDILNELYTLADQLEAEGLSLWDELGFYGGYYQSEYRNTPWDVITFGWTGGDGEHYGFLTEFGSIADLNEAPIVRVSPMGGDEAGEVIANNIREFLRMKSIDDTLLYSSYEDEAAYRAEKKQEEADLGEWAPTEADKSVRRQVMSRMVDALNLPEISPPYYTYLDRVKAERENRIVVATPDGLGVTNVHPQDEGKQHEALLVDDDLEAEELQAYLERATYAGKLALLRSFNAKDFNSEDIRGIIVQEMTSLGLTDEIARMNASAW
ncbi:hypothetical protein [Paenibacillus xanthanilyticus]|uniref:Copper amine oxidase-like N-terminal domain-containing protein n=1 Tax=Paenibacillus xanthanilyticus TaxID=1783531 RepID=A0ABV8K6K2_9BACL